MSQPIEEEVEQLIAEHGPRRPKACAALNRQEALVRSLRAKGASFDTVRQILSAREVAASETTIRNFCRDVLGETGRLGSRLVRKRRRPAVIPSRTNASLAGAPTPVSDGASAEKPGSASLPVIAGGPRSRGPRIANLKRLTDV